MAMVISTLFFGKNQFAANCDAHINRNGNPMREISSPKYRNQNETLTSRLVIAPIKVSKHPNFMDVAIPYFSLMIFPGMIIIAENKVKLTTKVDMNLQLNNQRSTYHQYRK